MIFWVISARLFEDAEEDDFSEGDLTDLANQTPIIRFVNLGAPAGD